VDKNKVKKTTALQRKKAGSIFATSQ